MGKGISRADFSTALAEMIATFAFVLLGVGAVGAVVTAGGTDPRSAYLVIGLGHGLGILIGIITVGRISGAHLNPAVTFAAVVSGNTSVVRGLFYVAGQLAGSAIAIAVLKNVMFSVDDLGLHQIAPALSTADGLLIEILLTSVLVFAVFAVAVDKRGNPALAPFAIAMVVTAEHFVAVGLTGASMNPARSFGPAVLYGNWNDHWVYWAGPLLGGLLGALVYVFAFGEREAREMVGKIKLTG